MGNVLTLSDKQLFSKNDEKALIKAGLQVTALFRYSLYNEYLIKTGKLDYDVIVIDDSLRNVNLYDTCHQLRCASKAVIIFIGNMPPNTMWEKCNDIGFDRYFEKPVQTNKLVEQIVSSANGHEPREKPIFYESSFPARLVEPPAQVEIDIVKENRVEPAPAIQPVVNIASPPALDFSAAKEKRMETAPVAEKADDIDIANHYDSLLAKEKRSVKKSVIGKTDNIALKNYYNSLVPKENPPIVMPVDQKACDINTKTSSELPPASENLPNLWHDPKVVNLINCFLKEKIKQLPPEINLGYGDGFSYREADNIMGTTGKETVLILESLAKQGILIKQDFEKILVSPNGSVQLVPVEKCPTCDSSNLTRGQLIEHFECGHIGLEEEFMKGSNQVCPKCRRELKLIGTDYRKPGMRYICNSCHAIFPTPVVKNRDLRTGEVFRLEELHYLSLCTYSLNGVYRQKLEFELEPKKQLIDYLVRLGYAVQESVQVKGRSGATHKIDIVATMDDLITRHTVAIGILAASNDETEVTIDPLFNYDSRIYDTGIDGKMVIAVPKFTAEAMKFAERQGIRVYSLEELRALLSRKIQLTRTIAANEEGQLEEFASKHNGNGNGHGHGNGNGKPDSSIINPRAWLKWLLEKRGYVVEEKLKVAGRSGAEHILDLFAQKDDGIINHKLAACVITDEDVFNNDVNVVMQFDTAAYDAGIRDKVLISLPVLSKEARQFADYQRIKIIDAKDLIGFSHKREASAAVRDLSAIFNKLVSKND